MMKAILEVEDNYYRVEYEHLNVESEDLYERAFAYELYHQWSKYVDYYRTQNIDRRQLCLNGEIKKCFWEEEKLPDLVLHMRDVDHQEIIVEIKRSARADGGKIATDLQKLYDFTYGTEVLNGERRINNNFAPYRMGVFILTCATMDALVNMLRDKANELNTISNNLAEIGKHLYCICIPQAGTIEYATLQELTNNMNHINI